MTLLLCARAGCRGRVFLEGDELVCLLCGRRTPLRQLPPLPLLYSPDARRREPGRYRSTAGCCSHGHPWTEENTRIDSSGYRRCRACHRQERGRVA